MPKDVQDKLWEHVKATQKAKDELRKEAQYKRKGLKEKAKAARKRALAAVDKMLDIEQSTKPKNPHG